MKQRAVYVTVLYVLCLYLTFSMLCATSVCYFFCVEGFQGAAFPLPHNLCICFMRRNLADSMELPEAETEFGFGARQLNLLTNEHKTLRQLRQLRPIFAVTLILPSTYERSFLRFTVHNTPTINSRNWWWAFFYTTDTIATRLNP